MLANHCGPHPLPTRLCYKSISVAKVYSCSCREFSIHTCWLAATQLDKFTRYVCKARLQCDTHTFIQAQNECFSLNIFIKIASNRIFSRCKTCCVCVNYKFWKIERWKKITLSSHNKQKQSGRSSSRINCECKTMKLCVRHTCVSYLAFCT